MLRKLFRSRSGPARVAAAGLSITRQFCQQGYVILPQLFSSEDIAVMRKAAAGLFPDNRPPYEPRFSNDAHFIEPIRSTIFNNAKLLGSMRELLGDDFLFLNEFGLHDSFFSGWHSDTSSPEAKGGHEFHWSPQFCVVNAAIYLQDGSLDVIPGSYVCDDPLAQKMLNKPSPENAYDSALSLPSKAGDVVIFHLRTSHRATPMSKAPSTESERKFALFMIAGLDNAHTRRYREWLDEYDRMNQTQRPAVRNDFRDYMQARSLKVI